MFKSWIITFINGKFISLKKRIILAGYNDVTIAKYFRKQGARIGENCRFQLRTLASEPYLVNIGNHVFISWGAMLHTHDGGMWILNDKHKDVAVFGKITIEDNCLIGREAHIFPNVHIGRNSIIGIGSVVISDIPPNSIAMGIPARVIGSTLKYEERCVAIWKEQRPPDLITDGDIFWWWNKENRRRIHKHLLKLYQEKV